MILQNFFSNSSLKNRFKNQFNKALAVGGDGLKNIQFVYKTNGIQSITINLFNRSRSHLIEANSETNIIYTAYTKKILNRNRKTFLS